MSYKRRVTVVHGDLPYTEITKPNHDVKLHWAHNVLWVYVDEQCVLRISDIPKFIVQDREVINNA